MNKFKKFFKPNFEKIIIFLILSFFVPLPAFMIFLFGYSPVVPIAIGSIFNIFSIIEVSKILYLFGLILVIFLYLILFYIISALFYLIISRIKPKIIYQIAILVLALISINISFNRTYEFMDLGGHGHTFNYLGLFTLEEKERYNNEYFNYCMSILRDGDFNNLSESCRKEIEREGDRMSAEYEEKYRN